MIAEKAADVILQEANGGPNSGTIAP